MTRPAAPPVATLAAMLLLGGCNLAPTYVRPDAPVPPALPQGAAYPALPGGETDMAATGWRDMFTDLRLRQVLEQALAQNRDLRVTVANVEQARAQYRIQRAGQFPTIAASAGATVADNGNGFGQAQGGSGQGGGTGTGNASGGRGTTGTFSLGASLSSFELDLFGRRRNLSRAAFESYLASEEGSRSARIALIAETANAWLTCAATADALALARDTLKSREETLRINRRREALGIGTGLEVAQAQTQFEAARADVADFTTSLAQARNALDLLAGGPVAEDLLPPTLGAGDAVLASLPVGLSSAVLLQRPDVLAAEHRLKAANADIGAARAALFPSISLTGLLGFASTSLGALFGDGFRWSAGASAAQTIFDGGATRGNLAYAQATRDAAVASYGGAIQTAFREVADALARRGTIDEKIAAQQSLADAAARAARLSQSRFAVGIASNLEPLDAQRTAYAAQQALITARLARASNMVELYRSLGGGLR